MLRFGIEAFLNLICPFWTVTKTNIILSYHFHFFLVYRHHTGVREDTKMAKVLLCYYLKSLFLLTEFPLCVLCELWPYFGYYRVPKYMQYICWSYNTVVKHGIPDASKCISYYNVSFIQEANGHVVRTSIFRESRKKTNSSLNIIHRDTFKRTNESYISPGTKSQINNEDASLFSLGWLCSRCGSCSPIQWRSSGIARKWVKGHSWRLWRREPRWKVRPFF